MPRKQKPPPPVADSPASTAPHQPQAVKPPIVRPNPGVSADDLERALSLPLASTDPTRLPAPSPDPSWLFDDGKEYKDGPFPSLPSITLLEYVDLLRALLSRLRATGADNVEAIVSVQAAYRHAELLKLLPRNFRERLSIHFTPKAARKELRDLLRDARAALRGKGIKGGQQPRKKIPAKYRTRPLGMAAAAALMGYTSKADGTSIRSLKDAVKMLRAAIEDGFIAHEALNRKQHVFDRRDFPAEAQAKL
jgi:hypothetical protein